MHTYIHTYIHTNLILHIYIYICKVIGVYIYIYFSLSNILNAAPYFSKSTISQPKKNSIDLTGCPLRYSFYSFDVWLMYRDHKLKIG